MKPYLVSLAAGVFVGLVYSVINVKSPAPPTIALIGLLGMLAGENMLPFARHLLTHVLS
ncbi:hypothetical protein LMG28727_06870 [Paraburkholderia kirstenboschensis]|uniref:DUF1427 family protein n=1 Tax=Paraburkholderia kirstenboschensis TaxID=1245436 RepID=UPI000A5700BB|nr:DUF1427 family protein [Paraburkholderia kirstenboschensis]CAD6559507.1 hypothetical protein LMG28727_06870 [Paraburkholderia kirstenboschensis]